MILKIIFRVMVVDWTIKRSNIVSNLGLSGGRWIVYIPLIFKRLFLVMLNVPTVLELSSNWVI